MQNNQDLEFRGQMDPLMRNPAEEPKQTEFDVVELLYHLVDKLPKILIVSVLCAALMFCWIYFVTPTKYQATTKLYVLNSDSLGSQVLSQLQLGNYLTSDYRQVFMNKEVHDQVLRKLGIEDKYTYLDLSKMLSITNPGDTRVLVLAITSEDQLEARQMAEEYAVAAEDFIENRMGGTLPEKRFEKVYSYMVDKQIWQNTVIAFVAAFLVMVVIYSVTFVTDDRITSSDFIEKRVGIVTLGMMPLLDMEGEEGTQRKKKKNGRKDG